MLISNTVESITKIQKPQVAALKKLGILTVADLLLHFPYRYLDFSQTKLIRDLKRDENVSLKVKIKSISGRFSFRSRMSLAEAVVSDESGSIKVVWFNQPYLAKSLQASEEIFLAGKADYYKNSLQLTNPIYERLSDFPIHTSRLVPLYHLKQGLYPRTFRNLVAQSLPLADAITETLPVEIIQNQKLTSIAQTVRLSHFPSTLTDVERAKRRLAFEEIFVNQLLAQKYKLELAERGSFSVKFDRDLVKGFVDSLPFALTAEQKKASWKILQDIEKPLPMNRLLEGDVGSGKTLVALIAALQAVSAGRQVVFLTPTEILAQQHFETIKKFIFGFQKRLPAAKTDQTLECCLLTNNFSFAGEKKISKIRLQQLIKEGMPAIYIGTHALLAAKVRFKSLALVIIDEQHRFGVEQRSLLIQNYSKVPHLLSLTATPIPRTLQLAFFGELDISRIKTKPLGRKNIISKVVEEANRPKAYEFIKKQILSGRQAFVITPLIQESQVSDTKSAKAEAENLKKIFPGFPIGLLHGRMKGIEKENVMKNFLDNKIQILVSTSVVEVGVDVPNASVMLIEGAEHFGLAQLHQFRGRVGRAEHQSYCFLFSNDENPETQKRLRDFTRFSDGFALAELDLKQRGFGEIYGAEQSGWDFKYFDPSYTSLIEPARREAKKLLDVDKNLEKYPILQAKIKDKLVHFE